MLVISAQNPPYAEHRSEELVLLVSAVVDLEVQGQDTSQFLQGRSGVVTRAFTPPPSSTVSWVSCVSAPPGTPVTTNSTVKPDASTSTILLMYVMSPGTRRRPRHEHLAISIRRRAKPAPHNLAVSSSRQQFPSRRPTPKKKRHTTDRRPTKTHEMT